MKNMFKPGLDLGKGIGRMVVALAVVVAITTGLAFSPHHTTLAICPSPTDLVEIGRTSSSISFAWTPTASVSEYEVLYVRHGANGAVDFTSPKTTVECCTYTFSGLAAGSYTFFVASKCGSEASGFIVTEDIING